jgi:hypothetical protein
MATTVIGPSVPAPSPASAGVEAVRHGGQDRRPARDHGRGPRRTAAATDPEEREQPAPVRPPQGRLDVLA